MKIFIDTNIFLDLILKREKYKEALLILNEIAQEKFEAIVLDISILNIEETNKLFKADTGPAFTPRVLRIIDFAKLLLVAVWSLSCTASLTF